MEKTRCDRLHQNRQGLEAELERVKADLAAVVSSERNNSEKRVESVLKERDELRVQLARAEENLVAMKHTSTEISQQLKMSEDARRRADESLVSLGVMVEGLKNSLAEVPTRDMVVNSYKSSGEYRREIVDARLAAVGSYKESEEFTEELNRAMARGAEEYKRSVAGMKDREEAGREAVAAFQASSAFKQAVGTEAGKMSVQIVESCREFFKEDIHRPVQEFGLFFTEFVRQRRGPSGDKFVSG